MTWQATEADDEIRTYGPLHGEYHRTFAMIVADLKTVAAHL